MKGSAIFNRFKDLLVINKIMDEIEVSLEIRDKTLSEFVLSLAKESKSVMQFEQKLDENGAEFSIELISTLYALITKMLPDNFRRKPTNFKMSQFEETKPSKFDDDENDIHNA